MDNSLACNVVCGACSCSYNAGKVHACSTVLYKKMYREDYIVAELASSSSHLMYCSYNFAASIELAINLHDESLHDCFVAIVLHMSAIVRPTVGDVRPTFGVV